MAKYLDLSGLPTLWGKVTSKFLRYDAAQTLTTAQQEQARANIAAGGSNRNLLDNPWWGTNESINQRGVTSGNGGYFVDRWNFSLPGTASVTWSTDENGFTGTTTTNFIITHKIPNVTELSGKTLTASVMLSDGTIHSGTIVRNNATAQEFFRNSNPTWVVLMDSDNSFRIRVFNGTLSIRAVKLELGTYSTLANDTKPEYGEELAKCIYSTADPADTYANNGFGRSNRNLLDNPWFTVNQREAATVSSVGYHLDRWYSYNNYTVTANGITTTSAGNFDQTLESALKTALNGQTVTMSAKLADGTVYSATGTYYSAYGSTYAIGSGGGITFYITGDGKARYTFGNNLSIRAVKLELGSVSTLGNDSPPTGDRELEDCRFYFNRISVANASFLLGLGYVNTNGTTVTFPNANKNMYKNPTVSYSGGLYLRKVGTEANHTFTGMSAAQNSYCVTLACTGASGLSAGDIVYIVGTATGYIDLSADL